MEIKSKVIKFYAIRLVIFSIIYFLFLEAFSLFVYIMIYPAEQSKEILNSKIQFDMEVNEVDFSVAKIDTIISVEGNQGVKLTFKSPSSRFAIELFEDFEDITVGWLYKGYEVSYKAVYQDEIVGTYIAQIFYYGQNQDSVITLEEFRENVLEEIFEKERYAYNSIYRRNILIFFSISASVIILALMLRFKSLYRKKLRRIQLKKAQSSEVAKEFEEK